MAVAFDAVATGSQTSTGTSIPNFTLTIGGGVSNGAVVVSLGFRNDPGTITVTVGGNSASLISGTDLNQDGIRWTRMFGLATGSDTGGQTVAVSWVNSIAAESGAAATSASGVDQGTPFQNGTSKGYAFGISSASITITSATNNLTLDSVVTNTTAPSGENQTERWNFTIGGATGMAGSTAAGAATNDHDWTIGTGRGAHSGVDIKAAAAGGISIPIVYHHRQRNF